MQIRMNQGRVEEGNQFVQIEINSYGIKLPVSKKEIDFSIEPDNSKFIQESFEILKKAKEFFVIVVDGIDIPEVNRTDYQKFFNRLLGKKKLPILFFTSDNILGGVDVFSNFQKKAESKKNIVLYVDERLRPREVEVERFTGLKLPDYPRRFVASEQRMVCLKS